MKTMTCSQLGGACDETFTADSFDEIAELSRAHGMEHMQDPSHMQAMEAMRELMQDPDRIQQWMDERRQAFENASEA